jgi:L-fuculose-phosphate aldolase
MKVPGATRRALLAHGMKLQPSGLSRTTSGNLSVRVQGGMLITPSGMDYAQLRPPDLVWLSLEGAPLRKGQRTPSSEWHFHAAIYRARPEAGAVVHAHAPFCTALAIHGRDIPAVHYMVAAAGGDSIRCAPYATFGTPDLARNALAALEGRKACLLAHHGMLAFGADLPDAFKRALEVEELAEQYWRALQLGTPPVLDAQEMARVVEKFQHYGQPPDTAPPTSTPR